MKIKSIKVTLRHEMNVEQKSRNDISFSVTRSDVVLWIVEGRGLPYFGMDSPTGH